MGTSRKDFFFLYSFLPSRLSLQKYKRVKKPFFFLSLSESYALSKCLEGLRVLSETHRDGTPLSVSLELHAAATRKTCWWQIPTLPQKSRQHSRIHPFLFLFYTEKITRYFFFFVGSSRPNLSILISAFAPLSFLPPISFTFTLKRYNIRFHIIDFYFIFL